MDDAEVAILSVRTGAAIVLERYGTAVERMAKSATDFATDVDIVAEQAIVRVLHQMRPDDATRGEELGAGGGVSTDRVWLVDPLCGTLNFAAHSPGFSVNIALVEAGLVVAAAVADPVAGEVHWTDGTRAATRGHSGTDRTAAPSPVSRLVDVNLDTDDPDGQGFSPSRYLASPAFRALRPRVLSTSLALAWVATGQRAGYVTAGDLQGSVHFTSGIALCQAAGCVLTNLRGGPLHAQPGGLIAAADAETHTMLLRAAAEQI